MTTATHDLLGRPAEEAARLIALDHLDAAAEGLRRLADPDDAEALHDFRVALRRLRSSLRAYRPYLRRSLPKKLRRQLRELAAATTVGRDTEVQLEWLAKTAHKKKLNPRQRPGLRWLVDRLEQRRQDAYRHIRGQVAAEFAHLRRRLTRRLSVYQAPVRRDHATALRSFAQVTAELVHTHVADLEDHLQHVRSPADETEAHQARISAKRLRYLLEPLRAQVPACAAAIAHMKQLQEVLGDLHDAVVLADQIRPAVEEAAAERARQVHDLAVADSPTDARTGSDARPGLLALARLVKQRRDKRFGDLEAHFLAGRGDALFAELRQIAYRLAASGGDDETGARIYLLRALPERAAAAEPVEIEVGFLPGQTIEEQVRRVSEPAGERCQRIVRARDGAVVEPIESPVFRALWPLTAGRRVRFQSYAIGQDAASWDIRKLRDRELCLAVARPLVDAAALEVPDWLAPYLVREVTEEPELRLRALAH